MHTHPSNVPMPLRLAVAAGMSRAHLRLVVVPPGPSREETWPLDDLQAAFIDELRELGGMAVVA